MLRQRFLSKCSDTNTNVCRYVGSTLSEKAVANAASYVTAKHAMVGLMRATCQDLAQSKAKSFVHTTAVCPGFVDTPMLRQHLGLKEGLSDETAAETWNWVEGRVGAGRLIAPSEVAELLHWAAENPLINGATLHANLGQIES